ncbi:hypothetical protein BH09ACT12_BH09ACT12_08460 [soil metagenome]
MNLKSRSTAIVLTGLLTAALTGCGSSDDTAPVASDPQPSAPASTDDGSEAASTDPEPSEPAATDTDGGSADTVAAPIYFVGDSPTGPRLYREFRQVESDNPLEEAAALLVAGDTLDPDYYTLLPSLDIASIETTDGAIVVTLGGDSPTADKATSRSDAKLAVQSLVYTLQGTAQTRDPVMVRQGDQPVALLGQPTDTGVEAADQLTVLSLVSVTTPESDAQVSGTITASGVASSFEANVVWEIRDDSDAVVLDGFATAEGFMDKLYPWETEIDLASLAPGDYTFAALTDDASGGEGPGAYEDTKAITVD